MVQFIFIVSAFFLTLTAQADFTVSKNTKCKVFLKSSEANLVVNWHGECQKGYAEGLGVVRYMESSKVKSIFYGVLKAGYWDTGVLEVNGGYIAGQFKNNDRAEVKDAQGVEDRNVTLKAFEKAAKAAAQLSEEFQIAGNKSSAKHYKAESEKLAQQMD